MARPHAANLPADIADFTLWLTPPMFDLAWSEIVLAGLVALVVLGPKELPQAMRAMGKFTRQARRLAGEFQSHVNDLIREAEVDDIKHSVDQVRGMDVGSEIDKMFVPDGRLEAELESDVAEAEQAMGTSATEPTHPAIGAVSSPVKPPRDEGSS